MLARGPKLDEVAIRKLLRTLRKQFSNASIVALVHDPDRQLGLAKL
jgi:hypothetical protein